MKKTLKALLLPLISLLLMPLMAACSDKEENLSDGKQIAGTYTGALTWKVQTFSDPFPGEYDVVITEDATTDDCVTVALPQCSFTIPNSPREVTIPSVTVHAVKVSESGNVYSFSIDKFKASIQGVDYDGENLSGKVVGKDVTLDYVLTPGTMPMPINFSFRGTLK